MKSQVSRMAGPVSVYIFGLVCIGVLIGFYAGGSATPVVQTTIPLLFAVIGGAGGFYIATAKIGNFWELRKIFVLGICLSGFSVGVLAGTIWGAVVRTGEPFTSFAGFQGPKEASIIGKATTASQGLALGLLDARAKALGISAVDRTALLKTAQAEIREKRLGLSERQIDGIVDAIQAIADEVAAAEAAGIQNRYVPAQEFTWRASLLGGMRGGNEEHLLQGQMLYLEEIDRTVRDLVNNPGISEIPQKQRQLLVELYSRTAHAKASLLTINWATNGSLTQSVDAFLKVAKGSVGKEPEPVNILVNRDNHNRSPGAL